MNYRIEFEQEEDGRWIADIPELPGVMAYGATKQEAQSKV
jgi:predicted RNase H-like HicB family nuclease